MSGSFQVLRLVPGEVDLATLRAIYQGNVTLTLDEPARQAIAAAQQTVDAIVASGNVVYGINTGFGKLAQTQIPASRLADLQRNLVLSHSVGLGDLLPTMLPVWWSPPKLSAWRAVTLACESNWLRRCWRCSMRA